MTHENKGPAGTHRHEYIYDFYEDETFVMRGTYIEVAEHYGIELINARKRANNPDHALMAEPVGVMAAEYIVTQNSAVVARGSIETIAEIIGVSIGTIYGWRKKSPRNGMHIEATGESVLNYKHEVSYLTPKPKRRKRPSTKQVISGEIKTQVWKPSLHTAYLYAVNFRKWGVDSAAVEAVKHR